MTNPESLLEALLAIATIIDDDNTAEVRLDGIRGVLVAIGMLRVGLPDVKFAPNLPSTPAEDRLAGILKAIERTPPRVWPTVGRRPRETPNPPRARKMSEPTRAKETPNPPRKPLVDDPERQERIRREFAGRGGKRPQKAHPKKKDGA